MNPIVNAINQSATIQPGVRSGTQGSVRNVPQFDFDNMVGKKEFLQSRPLINIFPGPKPYLNDNELCYGAPLGSTSDGIVAYSNDSSNAKAHEPCRVGSIVTGLPWQCVEFARRWLLKTQELIFDDVPLAANMWNGINHLNGWKRTH